MMEKSKKLKWLHNILTLYSFLEEKCELEEAENDSRLNAQRWEHQHKTTLEKSQLLSDELTCERKSNSILHSELETVQANLEESRNETAYFESLVQRYEQRVFDLEELEVELREKLALLEGAVQFAVWWNTVLMNQVLKLFFPSLCTLIFYSVLIIIDFFFSFFKKTGMPDSLQTHDLQLLFNHNQWPSWDGHYYCRW